MRAVVIETNQIVERICDFFNENLFFWFELTCVNEG